MVYYLQHQLDRTFSALADPTRRALLARLSERDGLSVSELAKPFDISGPAISRHLKVLERAGLIARGREAQWRPARLKAAPLKDAARWIEHYRRFWGDQLASLDAFVTARRTKSERPS